MARPKGYYSKAAKAARSAAYRARVESRQMLMAGMFKRKYVKSGKYSKRHKRWD